MGCRVGSRAFRGSNTNKDDSEWELAGSTKVPVGKTPYQSRAARPDREGRSGKCVALGIGVGGSTPIPAVLSGIAPCRSES